MPRESDLLFARLTVEMGFARSETVEACLAAAGSSPDARHLGALLIERGHITREQFRKVMAAAVSRSATGRTPEEEIFGRLCISMKLALGHQVHSAFEEQEAAPSCGDRPDIGTLLLRRGILTAEQAALVSERSKNFLLCPSCNNMIVKGSEPPGSLIACRRCDCVITMPDSPASPAGASQPSLRGHRIGKFTLVREIGKGAMGVVYEARDDSTGRPAALKVLPDFVSLDPAISERFRREAGLCSRLDHPAIVPVTDIGEEDGAFYIALEYVEGETLDAILSAGPLPVNRAVEIAMQVAGGLQHAHEAGVVHRDVKPGNIVIDRDNRARILDFGLAKRRDVATITASGAIVGTPMYMSPEQATPGATVDFSTDIYSLGATLYEMLTGIPPFTGGDVQALVRMVRVVEPPAPRAVKPDLPRTIENVVLKAMAKQPGRRYRSAADFGADLDAFARHGRVRARRPNFFYQAARLAFGYRDAVAVASAAVVVLAGALTLLSMVHSKGVAPAAGAPADEPAAEAFSAFRLGRHEEAVRLYTIILDGSPDDPDALLFRAVSLGHLGMGEQAIIDLRRLLAADPLNARARLEKARLLREAGRLDEALHDAEFLLAVRPGDREALLLAAGARIAAGDREGAARALRRVVGDHPDEIEAWMTLGGILVEAEPAQARDLMADLLGRNPGAKGAHRLAGRAWEALSEPSRALDEYMEEVRHHGMTPDLKEDIERARRAAQK